MDKDEVEVTGMARHKRHIRLLRIILWLLPAFAVPMCFLAASFLLSAFKQVPAWSEKIIALPIILGILATLGIGLVDQWIRNHQKSLRLWHRERGMLPWFVGFMFIQVPLVPLILFVTFMAIATISAHLGILR